MHGGGKPNEATAFSLGPALLLVETNVLGLGMLRAGGVLGGDWCASRGKRQHAGEDEERSNGESGRGNHVGYLSALH